MSGILQGAWFPVHKELGYARSEWRFPDLLRDRWQLTYVRDRACHDFRKFRPTLHGLTWHDAKARRIELDSCNAL